VDEKDIDELMASSDQEEIGSGSSVSNLSLHLLERNEGRDVERLRQ